MLVVLRFSLFGLVPKSTLTNRQLILDLSSPESQSVSYGIIKPHYSLLYVTVEEMVEAVIKKGWGARLAKVDIHNAYQVPGIAC